MRFRMTVTLVWTGGRGRWPPPPRPGCGTLEMETPDPGLYPVEELADQAKKGPEGHLVPPCSSNRLGILAAPRRAQQSACCLQKTMRPTCLETSPVYNPHPQRSSRICFRKSFQASSRLLAVKGLIDLHSFPW